MWPISKWDWGIQPIEIPLDPTRAYYSQAVDLGASCLLNWQRRIAVRLCACVITSEMWLSYRWDWKNIWNSPGVCSRCSRVGEPIELVQRGRFKFSLTSWILDCFCPDSEVDFMHDLMHGTLLNVLYRMWHAYLVLAFKLGGGLLYSLLFFCPVLLNFIPDEISYWSVFSNPIFSFLFGHVSK